VAVAAEVAPRAVPAISTSQVSRLTAALLAFPAAVSVGCLAAVSGFFVWTSTRGLDITDEGHYLVAARHPLDVAISVTASHDLLAPLFAAVRWNLPAYRVAGFAITILSALALTAGYETWRRRLDPDGPRSWIDVVTGGAATATGGLLGHSWLLTTPSYNWISNWAISIGTAAVLVTLAMGDAGGAVVTIAPGVLGLTLAAMFFSKFPSAIATGAIFIAVLMAWPLAPRRARLRWLAALTSGLVIGVAIYFELLRTPASWLSMLRLGLWDAATQNPLHSTAALARYAETWRYDVVGAWLKQFGAVFAALTALAVAIGFVPDDRPLGRVLRIVAAAVLVYTALAVAVHLRDYPPSLYPYDVARMFFGWLLLLGPLALAWRGLPRPAAPVALVVAMLFVLPFGGAMGTGNPLEYTMRYTLAPWFVLFALALGRFSAPARTRWAVPAGLAVLTLFSTVYLIKGPLDAPYRLLTDLRGQTIDTAIGDSGTVLKIDPELHDFITSLRRVADETGFKPGDDVIALFEMPGVVYALGGRSPSLPWWTSGYEGSRTAMARAIEVAGRERVRRAYILQTASSTAWLESLAGRGIDFPADYELGGTLTIPFSWTKEEVKWWRPRLR
jgi:hypothetical protein